MILLANLWLTFFSFAANSQDIPKAEMVIGSVTYLQKTVKVGSQFFGSGTLETGEKSFLRIIVPKWSSSIVVGSNTKMELNFRESESPNVKRYELKSGICRWVSGFKSKDKKSSQVFTKSAAMGIRGTDFEISHDEGSGETKLVVFQGLVELTSSIDATKVLVKAGHWSAVGGKFGSSVLPAEPLSSAELAKHNRNLREHLGKTPNAEKQEGKEVQY